MRLNFRLWRQFSATKMFSAKIVVKLLPKHKTIIAVNPKLSSNIDFISLWYSPTKLYTIYGVRSRSPLLYEDYNYENESNRKVNCGAVSSFYAAPGSSDSDFLLLKLARVAYLTFAQTDIWVSSRAIEAIFSSLIIRHPTTLQVRRAVWPTREIMHWVAALSSNVNFFQPLWCVGKQVWI